MTLEERFTEFVHNLQSAEIVDELKLSQEQERSKKPDFFFFERQFIGEMKSIKKDMEPKAKTILEEHKDRPEYPVFFGQWSSDKILQHLPDGESINEKMFYAITSALEDSVEKANRQIRETKKVFKINNSQGILIILNDFVEILSPDLIAHKVHQLLNKKLPSGDARYPHISVVWIVSEIHIIKTEIGQKLLPSIVLVNHYSHNHQEASDYVNWLQRKWASFNNMPFVEGRLDFKDIQFSKQETDSPEMIPRSEMWRKQYAQTPHLRRLSREQLLEYSQQLWFETLPAFIRGSHEKPAQETVFELMEKQTHLVEEINFRGIDFREFSPKLHEAFNRLQQQGKLKIQDLYVGEGNQANNSGAAD
jgi:hypothetical protein